MLKYVPQLKYSSRWKMQKWQYYGSSTNSYWSAWGKFLVCILVRWRKPLYGCFLAQRIHFISPPSKGSSYRRRRFKSNIWVIWVVVTKIHQNLRDSAPLQIPHTTKRRAKQRIKHRGNVSWRNRRPRIKRPDNQSINNNNKKNRSEQHCKLVMSQVGLSITAWW